MDFDATVFAVAVLGVAGTAGGSLIAYRAAKETAQEETERLRLQHREEERRNRQGTYHRMLAVFNQLDAWATANEALDATFERLMDEFNYVHGGVLLFGDERVTQAMTPVVESLARAGNMLAPFGGQSAAGWRQGYLAHRREIIEAQGNLVAAMRDDITG